jgi:hypothetical protein
MDQSVKTKFSSLNFKAVYIGTQSGPNGTRGGGSRVIWTRDTKQGASSAANRHTKNCHTSEQENNSTKKTVKLNTCMAAAQYLLKKEHAAVATGI